MIKEILIINKEFGEMVENIIKQEPGHSCAGIVRLCDSYPSRVNNYLKKLEKSQTIFGDAQVPVITGKRTGKFYFHKSFFNIKNELEKDTKKRKAEAVTQRRYEMLKFNISKMQ